MHFNSHYNLVGKHAKFSASNWHWINYDADKLKLVYENMAAKEYGTRLHAFAAECISLGQKLPRSKKTLNTYVNDSISYRMEPERVLYYSDNFFGTADAINFADDFLRIFDLKTGKIPAHMEQLEIYAALFCLEYKIKPGEIDVELRIYQNDEILHHEPTAEDILPVMDAIVQNSRILERIHEEG